MESDSKGSGRNSRRSVGKKVSFSIFDVTTFEEIAKLRKIRERELETFILNKLQTNQNISAMKYKNNIKQNISRNNQKKGKEDINKIIGKNRIKYFLTDEESNEKFSGDFIPKEMNKKEAINEEKINKFIKIINNLNNNNTKNKKIKKEVFQKLKKYYENLIDIYLDFENNDEEYNKFVESKKIFFIRKIAYDKFIGKIKQLHYNKLIAKKNEEEAKKFYLYSLYKKKALIFDAIKNYGMKQKVWIESIQAGLKKELVWSCIDSWKLYVNYKKIKRFLKMRKTKVIFDALRNNKQLSINLLKQSKKMSLILEYRHFFNNIRKNILSKKAKDINNKLLSEFRRQNLMRNIFNVLKENYRAKKEKENKYKKNFINKYEDKDFINIKISKKETYRINKETSIKTIQNKINI